MEYVIVTGAYGGMGKETIKLLKNKGYCVFALDCKVEEKEENIIPIEVDVTNEESVKNAFNVICNITKEIKAIIHYVGIYMLNSLVEISSLSFEKIMKVNVFGAFYINKAFMPLLKKDSRIIMVTSELATLNPLPFTGIYAITKSTLDKYAFSLKMELQLLDIKVSVIRSGAIKTNMLNISTSQLDDFVNNTSLYSCNAKRFKNIVDNVEAKNITPKKLAKKTYKILTKNNPKFAYSINNNILLKLLSILPKSLQFKIIKIILKP